MVEAKVNKYRDMQVVDGLMTMPTLFLYSGAQALRENHIAENLATSFLENPPSLFTALTVLGAIAGLTAWFREFEARNPEKFNKIDELENRGIDLLKGSVRTTTLQVRKLLKYNNTSGY